MKKKDLMDFIELVERKALNSVTDRHCKIINDEKEKLFESNGYNKRISNIQRKVNSLYEEVKTLVLDMNENKLVGYPLYRSDLMNSLSHYTGIANIKEQMNELSKFDGGIVPSLEKAKKEELKGVRDNYDLVKYVSKNKTTGKEVAEYLEGVGFDISSVRKGDDCVALSVEIDKSKLFVCGDNK